MQVNMEVVQRAIILAETWQNRASELVSDFDRKFHIKMNKMLSNPKDKVFWLHRRCDLEPCYASFYY